MKLFNVTDKERKKFISFYKSHYLNDPLKRDSMSGMVKGLIYGTSELCKSVDLEPLMVVDDNNKIIMICILAFAYRMQEFVQIGFFEADELNHEAFKLILDRAEQFAHEKGAYKISASLNIHVNYGLGFLASDYDKMQSFGMAHNPEFYHKFFEKNNFEAIRMVSYKKDMRNTDKLLKDEMVDRLNKIYTVREADFSNLRHEAEIYTHINNASFKEHLFYYPRKNEEDYELFKDLRFLIKPENLLFVEKEGTPVGFMLWYPDFNQVMSPGETVGIKTVIKNRLFSHKIDTFKIVEMGVVPEERNRGAILCLFNHCFKCINGKYDYMESGWILSENFKSKSFGIKWADCESKQYKAYTKVLSDEYI